MKNLEKYQRDFPLQIKIGFGKIFDSFRNQLSSNEVPIKWAEEIMALAEKYPDLTTGITSLEKLNKYAAEIDTILQPIFPNALGNNEIKFATVPFHDVAFKSSPRYKKIMKAAGCEYHPDLTGVNGDHFYILGCSLILEHYYGKRLDFKRNF